MKAGNSAVNLSINSDIAAAVKSFVAGNRRKGRKDVSELTETLWIGYLRRKGVKLPLLLKPSTPSSRIKGLNGSASAQNSRRPQQMATA